MFTPDDIRNLSYNQLKMVAKFYEIKHAHAKKEELLELLLEKLYVPQEDENISIRVKRIKESNR